jgi:hypothetical protein
MIHQIPQNAKGFGLQKNALLIAMIPAPPETLITSVQPEWIELLHARDYPAGVAS